MNYKSLTIIALALCLCVVPALAAPVWSAGNYVTDGRYDNCDSVKYNPQTDVYSCYRDNNPVNEIKASENGNGGIAVGSIRAGYSTLSNRIEVRNVLQEANSTGKIIEVLPDATFRIPKEGDGVLAPGNYSATLDNFNLPDETVYFTIAANQQEPTRISFIGQAATAPSVCNPFYTIEEANYGLVHCSNVQVLVTPAKDHVWSTWSDHKPQNWNSIPNAHREIREVDEQVWHDAYCHYGWSGWHCHDGYFETMSHKEYRFVTEDAHEAVYETECQHDGDVIDVTGNVQTAVGLGATEFMFFDNAQKPGGIFGAGNVLLSEIVDPSVENVKDVYIKYNNGCGLERTIKTKEYCNINLVSGSATCPSQHTPN